jgi:CDGSH-type Zn-finger protein
MNARSKITCVPNGPYSLLGEGAEVRRSSGERLAAGAKASLCRCGGSKNKPFCDGTHRTNGFSDANTADPVNNRKQAYAGKGIMIFDNRALCAHAGYCTDSLKSVFRYGEEPWIDPDGAPAREIIAAIAKCPSGALSYAIDGVEAQPPQRPPTVTVTDHGPYAITGGIELEGMNSSEHYTLCRCGASKNKPFCDGSHWDAGFKDPT